MRIIKRGGDPDRDKVCWKCDAVKPRSQFYRSKSRGDGLDARCKSCSREAQAAIKTGVCV
jgi:hypothetical protein